VLELYQFEMSHYCEKVRLILDYKGLAYRKIEVTPGIGQLELYKMSGQRLVPILKDETEIVADSTAIATYLDRKYPEFPILPEDNQQRALCLLMEAWADDSIGLNSRTALLGAFSQDQSLRKAALPAAVPDFFKNLVGAVPGELLNILGIGVGLGPDTVKEAQASLAQNLEILSTLLQDKPYLIGEQPTLADFAVAGITMYIKFPDSPHVDIPDQLKGKGVAGLADNPAYEPFFQWRDRIYEQYRKPLAVDPATETVPTPVEIQ